MAQGRHNTPNLQRIGVWTCPFVTRCTTELTHFAIDVSTYNRNQRRCGKFRNTRLVCSCFLSTVFAVVFYHIAHVYMVYMLLVNCNTTLMDAHFLNFISRISCVCVSSGRHGDPHLTEHLLARARSASPRLNNIQACDRSHTQRSVSTHPLEIRGCEGGIDGKQSLRESERGMERYREKQCEEGTKRVVSACTGNKNTRSCRSRFHAVQSDPESGFLSVPSLLLLTPCLCAMSAIALMSLILLVGLAGVSIMMSCG